MKITKCQDNKIDISRNARVVEAATCTEFD